MMQADEEPRPRAMGMGLVCTMRQRRDLLPHLVEQALGRAVDQVGLVAGDAGPVRCRDVQLLALLKGHGVVQGHRQAQGIEAGADIGAGGRDRDFDLRSLHLPFSMLPPAASSAPASRCRPRPPPSGLLRPCALCVGLLDAVGAAVEVLIHHTARAVDGFHHGRSNACHTHIICGGRRVGEHPLHRLGRLPEQAVVDLGAVP